MRRRISGEFSPMPAVNTSPSMPPSTAASAPISFAAAVDEVVHRQACGGLVAVEQVAHVVADAGDAEQARLLVEDRLHLLRREPEPLEEIEDDAGIDGAGPRAHAQPVERGEAERAVDALAVLQRAQARAAAQMRDDHAAVGDLRCHLRQHRGDVLVRQAVEAVALDAGAAEIARAAAPARRPPAARDGSWCRSRRPAARRAAARSPPRSPPGCTADGAVPAARARADPRAPAACHQRRTGEVRAAMDDAMADAEHARAAVAASGAMRRDDRAPCGRRARSRPAADRRRVHPRRPWRRSAATCRCLRSGRAPRAARPRPEAVGRRRT